MTYFLNGAEHPDTDIVEKLNQFNVRIELAPIKAIVGDDVHRSDIQFENEKTQATDALFISPYNTFDSDIASQLGCDIVDQPLGKMFNVDEMKMTTIKDVYAVGDTIRDAHNVTFATGDGVMAAMAIHRSLVFDTPQKGRAQ